MSTRKTTLTLSITTFAADALAQRGAAASLQAGAPIPRATMGAALLYSALGLSPHGTPLPAAPSPGKLPEAPALVTPAEPSSKATRPSKRAGAAEPTSRRARTAAEPSSKLPEGADAARPTSTPKHTPKGGKKR